MWDIGSNCWTPVNTLLWLKHAFVLVFSAAAVIQFCGLSQVHTDVSPPWRCHAERFQCPRNAPGLHLLIPSDGLFQTQISPCHSPHSASPCSTFFLVLSSTIQIFLFHFLKPHSILPQCFARVVSSAWNTPFYLPAPPAGLVMVCNYVMCVIAEFTSSLTVSSSLATLCRWIHSTWCTVGV